MIKKILIILPLLFFIVFPKTTVFAQQSSGSAAASPTPVVTTTNYTLPYPGILPDNPFYFFKVLRDNIVVFFISNPVKKSSFYMLQSDKRLAASWYLLKEGTEKDELALTTLAKSTNYFSLAVDQVHIAQKSGVVANPQIDSLKDAMTKHLSVIASILQIPDLKNRDNFVKEQKRLQNLADVVSKLSPQ